MVYIYSLSDPQTGQVRYVGKTIDVRRRLLAHLRGEQRDTSHRARWISKLLRNGWEPSLSVLEVVSQSDWQESEQRWIAHYRSIGCELTNSTDGGDGAHNPSPEVRLKIGAAMRGKKFSESHKMKIRNALIGKVVSDDARMNMSRGQKGNRNCIGRKLSEETKLKIRLAHLGMRDSEETKGKKRVGSTGRKHTEYSKAKVSEAKTLWHQNRRMRNRSS